MRMSGLFAITLLARPATSFTSNAILRSLATKATTKAPPPPKSSNAPASNAPSRLNTLRRRFYATPNPDPKGPAKKVVRPPLYRADRVLSNRGFGSRSECFSLLQGRRVAVWSTQDEQWHQLSGPSDRIHSESRIMVDGKEVAKIPLLVKYHKPKWVLSVMRDPKDRPNLSHVIPDLYMKQGLHPVGRLDYDTSGLLLFSSSGPLTQRLLHPSHDIAKEYVATVEGLVNEMELKSLLEGGVETAEGTHTANLLHVQHLTANNAKAILNKMRSTLPKDYNKDDLEERGYLKNDITEMSLIRLEVTEGKHRMVRRMLANCGHAVVELKREQHGGVHLGDLPEGEFQDLTESELEWVQDIMPARSNKGKKKRSEEMPE